MPTYEYKCADCKHQFDVFQNMTAKPLKTCPKCKKNKLRRLIGSGAGIIFKGSGFYATDYRKPSSKEQSSSKSQDACPAKANGSCGGCK